MTDWRELELGSVLELKRGYDLPAARREPGAVPVVSSSGRSGLHSTAKVSGPGVVTGRYGTLGEVYFIPEDFWPLNTALYVRDFKGNNPRFVAALLKSLELGRNDSAAAVPGVNRNHLHQLTVRIPSRDAQDRIGALLLAFDDLIGISGRRIALLEQMAQAIYLEWFVHFRYPGHEDDELVSSPFGPIPFGWEMCRLFDVAAVNATRRDPSKMDSFQYLDISSLRVRAVGSLTRLPGAEAPGRARRGLAEGDVVWATVRPARRAHALLLRVADDLVGSTALAVITPRDVPSSYLFEALSDPSFTDYLTGKEQGAAYPAVVARDFEVAPILLPPEDLRKAFDRIVAPAHQLVAALREQAGALVALRDFLLPKLVKGKIDVSSLDIDELVQETAA